MKRIGDMSEESYDPGVFCIKPKETMVIEINRHDLVIGLFINRDAFGRLPGCQGNRVEASSTV
jgi:hypothetical protein